MAAIYWHLHIAEKNLRLLKSSPEPAGWGKSILLHPDCFSSGSIGPDLNYFPGGDTALSKLAHRKMPIDLGKALLSDAGNSHEEAYACGWMLHIVTDLITHQLVNRRVAERFHGSEDALRFTNDPLGHHRIEWGIDASLVGEDGLLASLPLPEKLVQATGMVSPMLSRVFGSLYGEEPSHDSWVRAHKGLNRTLRLVCRLWRITGRIRDPRRFLQSVKTIGYYMLLFPLARAVAVRSPESGIGIAIPVLPADDERKEILEFTERVCNDYRVHLNQQFAELRNIPLEG